MHSYFSIGPWVRVAKAVERAPMRCKKRKERGPRPITGGLMGGLDSWFGTSLNLLKSPGSKPPIGGKLSLLALQRFSARASSFERPRQPGLQLLPNQQPHRHGAGTEAGSVGEWAPGPECETRKGEIERARIGQREKERNREREREREKATTTREREKEKSRIERELLAKQRKWTGTWFKQVRKEVQERTRKTPMTFFDRAC